MTTYSPTLEAQQIFQYLCKNGDQLGLPPSIQEAKEVVKFSSDYDRVYFPIPFKEMETAAALKALEGFVAHELADLRFGKRERTAYLATVDGLGKLDPGVRSKLKDTDFLRAQSDPYRRMSANMYETKTKGEYYHIHGSLEASRTLNMIGLESFRPDLDEHDKIVSVIEPAVRKFTVDELEIINANYSQASRCPSVRGISNKDFPAWTVISLETKSAPAPLRPPSTSSSLLRILYGIKVLELCRIIAGPTIGRILAEYGADVLKITGPGLSDVPFFQVVGNMGKHAAELNLKSPEGRQTFEQLLEEADVILDGYRPGALDNLGYGAQATAKVAQRRGKDFVYVNENCFGYTGEWANRPGWQQIADCVSGVAWAQGKFMKLNEPVVPPFPISDYGTGCIGAIAALSGLYNRATKGGSWHGKVSLLHYDLLPFKVGQYPEEVQEQIHANCNKTFLALRHNHSVDHISGTALSTMQKSFPQLFDDKYCQKWFSNAYGADIRIVKPVVEISGVEIGFQRASRPNGSDVASWDFSGDDDFIKE